MTQDKNALKFAGRLFLEFDKMHTDIQNEGERLKEVNDVLQSLCDGDLGKIKLGFFKKLFKDSQFSRINRRILYKVLGDVEILNRELHGNGNVKKKTEYLYACKLLRLRCRSGSLCERAQSR
jgi:hypothetical protein